MQLEVDSDERSLELGVVHLTLGRYGGVGTFSSLSKWKSGLLRRIVSKIARGGGVLGTRRSWGILVSLPRR